MPPLLPTCSYAYVDNSRSYTLYLETLWFLGQVGWNFLRMSLHYYCSCYCRYAAMASALTARVASVQMHYSTAMYFTNWCTEYTYSCMASNTCATIVRNNLFVHQYLVVQAKAQWGLWSRGGGRCCRLGEQIASAKREQENIRSLISLGCGLTHLRASGSYVAHVFQR